MSLIRSTLAVLGAAVIATSVSVVATATPALADSDAAVVRSAHFSPDTAGVDVYLAPFSGGSTTLWVSNEQYGSLSPYQRITPGAYVVSMRPHNAPATTTPTLTWTLDAKAGSAYTAAAIGTSSALKAVVLTDDLTTPAAGSGRVRIVQAASTAPSVSVAANGGVTLASKLTFGSTSAYQTVPTGQWDVRATPDSGSAVPVTGSVAIAAGSSSTVVVLDGPDGALKLTSVQDAASSAAIPAGSVDAGGGGAATRFADTRVTDTPLADTAPAGSSSASWVLVGLAGLLGVTVLGGLGVRTRRRRGVVA